MRRPNSERNSAPSAFTGPSRGVQYVHWVMHKCIMVKVGGENTRKVCKKLLNFVKTGGEILETGGKLEIFANQGGNVVKQAK